MNAVAPARDDTNAASRQDRRTSPGMASSASARISIGPSMIRSRGGTFDLRRRHHAVDHVVGSAIDVLPSYGQSPCSAPERDAERELVAALIGPPPFVLLMP
jgi:hypothetical protein